MRPNVGKAFAFAEWWRLRRLAHVIAFPRYALASPSFRFRAVIALADKLPLGGDREVALATWLAARLLWGMGAPGRPELDGVVRTRAAATRQWGQSLTLPVPARNAFHQTIDAAARGDRTEALHALEGLLGHTSRAVEVAIRPDRRLLEARLEGRSAEAHD